MRCLQVRPVLSRRPRRRIPELLPSGHRPDLVYHKGERVLCIGRLLVVDGAETAMTNAALAAHCLQPCTMFAPKRTVCVSWVAHGFSLFLSARRAADGTASLRFLPAFCICLPALPPSCISAGSAQPLPVFCPRGFSQRGGIFSGGGIKNPRMFPCREKVIEAAPRAQSRNPSRQVHKVDDAGEEENVLGAALHRLAFSALPMVSVYRIKQ